MRLRDSVGCATIVRRLRDFFCPSSRTKLLRVLMYQLVDTFSRILQFSKLNHDNFFMLNVLNSVILLQFSGFCHDGTRSGSGPGRQVHPPQAGAHRQVLRHAAPQDPGESFVLYR